MGASPRNGRPRSAETVELTKALVRIVHDQHPMSVRGAYYAATVAGAVPKTEAGYTKVQRLLVRLREDGTIPWHWITDGTRWRRGARTYDSVEDALQATAALYRRNLWDDSPDLVEVWLEKDALSGVVYPVTSRWTVDLMVCRGYPSVSFVHGAAEAAKRSGKWLTIYYLGDLDPSGKDIPRSIEDRLESFGVLFNLVELAVTREQVDEWDLPTRPTKATDTRARNFTGASVELDAIPAPMLRHLVEEAILSHLDMRQVDVLTAIEKEERDLLMDLATGR